MSIPTVPRGLAAFLRAYQERTPDPSDTTTIKDIARCWGCSIEDATRRLGAIFHIRSLIEEFIGREIGDEPSIRAVFNGLSVEFGLPATEAEHLHPTYLLQLLTHFQRWKRWGEEERQGILRQVAEIREQERRTPIDPVSSPIFLKALDRFPDPIPLESREPIGAVIEAEVPRTPVPDIGEPSSPTTPRKPPRKRDQDKAKKCVGIYMAAIERNETPPTPTEIA